ncbi:MAG: BatD family protein [Pseudohaliea sp.]
MARSGEAWLRRVLRCAAFLALLVPCTAFALEASVDRYRVSLGDSLRLTLRSDGGVDPAEADLAPLTRDFEILQRSSSSSTRIINGRASREVALELEITPRREGTLSIPPLSAGGEQTAPLVIEVEPPPAAGNPDATVLFSAELDRDSVYVQQQVLLTLRIQQAIALDDRSVTELKLDGAFVKPLGQNSFQRDDGSRRWLVHEIRYAIFPEQSGTLEIPVQTFSATVRQGSRSLFDLRSGPRLSRQSEPLTVTVRARPDAFPGQTWLPAAELTIEESWSRPPEQLATGESVTRTVTLTGKGLQGAQLPPVRFPATAGLKYYPDQPQIEDAEGAGGVIGVRTDSAALVPVAPGSYEVPELRIPWWDTEADRLRWAVLPARTIRVTPAAGAAEAAGSTPAAVTPGTTALAPAGPWPWIASACAAGWLLTGLLWWRSRRRPAGQATRAGPRAGEPRAWKQLRAALASGEPAASRRQLADWLRTLPGARPQATLAAQARAVGGEQLAAAVAALDAALYGPTGGSWDPAALDAAARAARRRHAGENTRVDGDSALPPLYPGNT